MALTVVPQDFDGLLVLILPVIAVPTLIFAIRNSLGKTCSEVFSYTGGSKFVFCLFQSPYASALTDVRMP